MTRRSGQGARGPRMSNAATPRISASLVSYEGPNRDIAPEVEDYAAVPKCKGGRYKLNKRRHAMRASMARRSGSTGVGCVSGCIGTIVCTLTEAEKTLLNSMLSMSGNNAEEVMETEMGEASDAEENFDSIKDTAIPGKLSVGKNGVAGDI